MEMHVRWLIAAGMVGIAHPAWAADDAERPRMVTVKERAPDRSVFLQDLHEDEALVAKTSPWEVSFFDTPISAGPWSEGRHGAAQVETLTPGSAREPIPRVARWGSEDDEPNQSTPWGGSGPTKSEPILSNKPLDNNFPLRILGHEADALQVELPLLITPSPTEYDGRKYWVVVEFFVDGTKVGDHRLWVDQSTIATMGPTHAWVKALIPIPSPQGQLDVRVSRLFEDKQASEGMFIRSVRFGK